MQVNVAKTIGIPLWPAAVADVRKVICDAAPAWKDLPLKAAGVYLGCVIGPGKHGDEWRRAAARFADRIRLWQWSSLGLYFATVIYNVFAFSVLTFTAQVARVPDEMIKLEAWALRRAAPGPGGWCTPQDLWHLQQCYGMPQSFASLDLAAKAAKLRLTVADSMQHGGLRMSALTARIGAAGRSIDSAFKIVWWGRWHTASIPVILQANRDELRRQGIDGAAILKELTATAMGTVKAAVVDDGQFRAAAEQAKERARRRLQHVIGLRLRGLEGYCPHFRIRAKFERWKLEGVPHKLAARFEHRLPRLGRLVPPRVVAAVFSTAWNRWCTARRFQRRGDPINVCQLGCGGEAEDSIEHYCRCRTLRACHQAELGLQEPRLLTHWLCVQDSQGQDAVLVRGALGAYAAYCATNAARHMGGMSRDEAMRAFRQALSEVLSGGSAASRILGGSRGTASRAVKRLRLA